MLKSLNFATFTLNYNTQMLKSLKFPTFHTRLCNFIMRERERERLPQMRIGAWSSRRLGWERRIWRALEQSWRISHSDSWTCLPPLPSSNLLMISSNTPFSIIPSILVIIVFSLRSQVFLTKIETWYKGFVQKQERSNGSCLDTDGIKDFLALNFPEKVWERWNWEWRVVKRWEPRRTWYSHKKKKTKINKKPIKVIYQINGLFIWAQRRPKEKMTSRNLKRERACSYKFINPNFISVSLRCRHSTAHAMVRTHLRRLISSLMSFLRLLICAIAYSWGLIWRCLIL